MKGLLKNRKFAFAVMIAAAVIALLVGMNRSAHAARTQITDEYYYSNTGIQSQLNERMNLSTELTTLAQTSETGKTGKLDSLIQKVEEDTKALRKADSPAKQFEANSQLTASFAVLANEMQQTASAKEIIEGFEKAQSLIQEKQNWYNQRVAEYNSTISSLPATLFSWAIQAQPLEEFR